LTLLLSGLSIAWVGCLYVHVAPEEEEAARKLLEPYGENRLGLRVSVREVKPFKATCSY